MDLSSLWHVMLPLNAMSNPGEGHPTGSQKSTGSHCPLPTSMSKDQQMQVETAVCTESPGPAVVPSVRTPGTAMVKAAKQTGG